MSGIAPATSRRSRDLDHPVAFSESRVASEYEAYTSGPSTGLPPDDPIPLFLSELQRRPDLQELAPFSATQRITILTRVVTGGLAVLASAILVAAINSDVTRTLVANSDVTRFVIDKVWAPIRGASSDQSPNQPAAGAAPSLPAVRHSLLKDAAAVAPEPQGNASAERAGNEAVARSKTPDAETLAALMARAKRLLALGDIVAARLLLERAASAQDANAALLLARTYDPAVLGVRDTRSVAADALMARNWYRKAASFGSADAQRRLTQLQN
jgi:TPR repeat protein